MSKAIAYITVGKVASPYGVKGWLKIQSYTEFGASILNYQPWYLSDPHNQHQAVVLEESRMHGNGIVAKFQGIDSPEAARLLTGKLIAVDRSLLPALPENEFYWSDLQGLTVIDLQGKNLGTVTYLMETGSNDVLVIKDAKGQEHALPYLFGTVVRHIDLSKREILVDWELL
jgi:16S rRNA processing protein RimM